MAVPQEHRDLFAAYVHGPTLVREAIAGLDAAGVAARGAEEWSVRDILHHLGDAELVRAVRLRMAVADEAVPAFVPFDESRWQRRLQYLWRSPEAALALFEQVVFSNGEILSHCERGAWERHGEHITDGPKTVATLLTNGVDHFAAHCAQIGAIRAATGR